VGYSSDEVVKALRRLGFEIYKKRGKGSHIVMVKKDPDKTRIVVIPKQKELKKGTLSSILRQAGITFEDLKNSL